DQRAGAQPCRDEHRQAALAAEPGDAPNPWEPPKKTECRAARTHDGRELSRRALDRPVFSPSAARATTARRTTGRGGHAARLARRPVHTPPAAARPTKGRRWE